jgi:GT2 family glycosyltransferase
MSNKRQLDASVIIATYNRSASLARALSSLNEVDYPRDLWEIIVVDSSKTDDSKQVAEDARRSMGLDVKYIREERLSFTVARHTGAAAAESDILLYIDDDVTVEPGWMKAVVECFRNDPKVGAVGGPVRAAYEVTPPDWVLRMDGIWLSLYDAGNEVKEDWAVGPNLSVRKSVLTEVGGFPADAIGIDTGKPGGSKMICIGPGDGGLCMKVKAAGLKVLWVPGAVAYHHIPPMRLTKSWWHSRLAEEGRSHAITHQYEHHLKPSKLRVRALRSLGAAGKTALLWLTASLIRKPAERHAFKTSYYISRMRNELALVRDPQLADRLWEIDVTGILPDDYSDLIKSIP